MFKIVRMYSANVNIATESGDISIHVGYRLTDRGMFLKFPDGVTLSRAHISDIKNKIAAKLEIVGNNESKIGCSI